MRCPTCEEVFEPAVSTALPFCSERCRLIDLGRWLDERHSVPFENPSALDGEGSDANSER